MAPNQSIVLPQLLNKGLKLSIKRLDLANRPVTGNKYYKLKYNLEAASNKKIDTLLTFGGAYSNHILATARAGEHCGFKTIGIIRGEELENSWQQNPTLATASEAGMQFKFVSREQYRQRHLNLFHQELELEFGRFYLLPEGGTNDLAIKGCEEILDSTDSEFDLICCSVGTGGTLAGLANSLSPNQSLLGFASLKSDSLMEDICKFTTRKNWEISADYHFGGYAKVNKWLIEFLNKFKKDTGIPLDPVYTGKMVFGIMDLVDKNFFIPGSSILVIHSGGLQGINGMNPKLKMKNLPLIDL